MATRVAFDVDLMLADVASRGWSVNDLVGAVSRLKPIRGQRPPSYQTIYRFFRGDGQTAKTAKWIARALGRNVDRYIRVRAHEEVGSR